jgi:hypothetical protein
MKYASIRLESIILFSSRIEDDANGAKPRPIEDPMVIRGNLDHSLSAACTTFFFAYRRIETSFLEFRDEPILTPKKAAAETVLAADPVKEVAVQTVEKDPLGIYSSSSEDSDFDLDDTDVRDVFFRLSKMAK